MVFDCHTGTMSSNVWLFFLFEQSNKSAYRFNLQRLKRCHVSLCWPNIRLCMLFVTSAKNLNRLVNTHTTHTQRHKNENHSIRWLDTRGCCEEIANGSMDRVTGKRWIKTRTWEQLNWKHRLIYVFDARSNIFKWIILIISIEQCFTKWSTEWIVPVHYGQLQSVR